MNETQIGTGNRQNLAKMIIPYVATLVLIVLGMAAMSLFFPTNTGNTLDPAISLSTVVILFVFAMLLKVNYTSKLFIITLVMGLFLASLTTFTQALLAMMVVILVQKLLKFI